MKRVEVIIRPEKMNQLQHILDEEGVTGANIISMMGYGQKKDRVKKYRGAQYCAEYTTCLKIETIVSDGQAEKLCSRVCQELASNIQGEGNIFLYDVSDVIHINSGMHGVENL